MQNAGDERGFYELWQQKYILIYVRAQEILHSCILPEKVIRRHNPADKYMNQRRPTKKLEDKRISSKMKLVEIFI